MDKEKPSYFSFLLPCLIILTFIISSCTPAYVKRLERIENLLDNLEKEIKLTKTEPELASINASINSFSTQIKKISSLDYSKSDKYKENGESLSEIMSDIQSIRNEIKTTDSQKLDNALKKTFLSSSENILTFLGELKNRDISISKGEAAYKKAEESMNAANEALKKGKRDEAEFNLKAGKESLNTGNMEFVKASAMNEHLLKKRDSLIIGYDDLSLLVREKLGLELFEIFNFKFLDKDKKRLERTVDNLKGKN